MTGVPFKFPTQFPVNTVLPMRVLTALQLHEATEKYEQCIDKVIHGLWPRSTWNAGASLFRPDNTNAKYLLRCRPSHRSNSGALPTLQSNPPPFSLHSPFVPPDEPMA